MTEIEIKRRIALHSRNLVKYRAGEESFEAFGNLLGAMGDLFGLWTGQKVRIQLSADGQDERLDTEKRLSDQETRQ